MRHAMSLIVILALSALPIKANQGSDKFFDLATSCSLKGGALEINPYRDSPFIHNGVQVSVRDETTMVLVKQGDILETWTPLLFYRYKLDQWCPIFEETVRCKLLV